MSSVSRPYDLLCERITPGADRRQSMRLLVDVLWNALSATGVSWIGFYLHEGGEELVLGPRRDRPACSPIGMHGACGQAFRSRRPLIVRDVKDLGENYIACDPRDRSEVVVPLFASDGCCWGVLDLDSHEVAAFDDSDVSGLQLLLQKAGLTR